MATVPNKHDHHRDPDPDGNHQPDGDLGDYRDLLEDGVGAGRDRSDGGHSEDHDAGVACGYVEAGTLFEGCAAKVLDL